MIANINVSLNTNQVKVISEYHFAAKMFTVMETVLSDFFDKDERIWNIPFINFDPASLWTMPSTKTVLKLR